MKLQAQRLFEQYQSSFISGHDLIKYIIYGPPKSPLAGPMNACIVLVRYHETKLQQSHGMEARMSAENNNPDLLMLL